MLWEEYRAKHPDGYGYSRFCDLYIDWRRGVSATMRQLIREVVEARITDTTIEVFHAGQRWRPIPGRR